MTGSFSYGKRLRYLKFFETLMSFSMNQGSEDTSSSKRKSRFLVENTTNKLKFCMAISFEKTSYLYWTERADINWLKEMRIDHSFGDIKKCRNSYKKNINWIWNDIGKSCVEVEFENKNYVLLKWELYYFNWGILGKSLKPTKETFFWFMIYLLKNSVILN